MAPSLHPLCCNVANFESLGNVNRHVRERDLKHLMGRYGRITDLVIMVGFEKGHDNTLMTHTWPRFLFVISPGYLCVCGIRCKKEKRMG